jgi:hypothetical protein
MERRPSAQTNNIGQGQMRPFMTLARLAYSCGRCPTSKPSKPEFLSAPRGLPSGVPAFPYSPYQIRQRTWGWAIPDSTRLSELADLGALGRHQVNAPPELNPSIRRGFPPAYVVYC